MSFSSDVKNEVAQKVMEGNDARAELSALVQMTSILSLSNRGMNLLIQVENAAVARTMYRIIKERYNAEMELFVKRKMNLKKNRIYGLRVLTNVMEILKDLGIYTSKGLRDKPLSKIVVTDNNARAYLAGAFLASGSMNPPETTSYHLEITAISSEHADFLVELMDRFNINAKVMERRKKDVVYVKAADKIGDFLRCIDASSALMKFEDVRIQRDFSNSITRLNNCDVANEVKTQAAATKQLEDISQIRKDGKFDALDDKLKEVITLRESNPDASLIELCDLYERKTGSPVSKSGMKHRFVKIHDIAMKGHEDEHV